MIICHKYKFIFIKTRKTAGTSIDLALSEFCDEHDVIAPRGGKEREKLGYPVHRNWYIPFKYYKLRDIARLILKGRRKKFRAHSNAAFIKANIRKKVWATYYKFCFERNPYDKVISDFYWRKAAKRNIPDNLSDFILSPKNHLKSDLDKYLINGELVVDFIGKYETLQRDLDLIQEKLNLPHKLILPSTKSSFRKDKRSYNEVLSQAEKDKIKDFYQKEIELLGYDY